MSFSVCHMANAPIRSIKLSISRVSARPGPSGLCLSANSARRAGAEELGCGIEFADEVSSLIWGGTNGWDQGDLLAQAVAKTGLDLAQMDERIVTEAQRLDTVIETNQADHDHSGHWGVPTCTFNGEPFFGQDRLDVLLWRLQKEGLQTR